MKTQDDTTKALVKTPQKAGLDPAMTKEQTIESMLPLVRHIVSRMAIYLPAHITKDDLISAGVMGLMDAVNKFDPTRGASLVNYCHVRIRGSVLDELRRLDWVPRAIHEEARQLATAQDALSQKLGREPEEEEVREAMGLTPEDFYELVDRVKPVSFFSLQEPTHSEEGGEALIHEEVLADPRAVDSLSEMLRNEDIALLQEHLKALPKPQLIVISLYYLEGLRVKEIAEVMELTEARVSQIHALAISRLRRTLERVRRR